MKRSKEPKSFAQFIEEQIPYALKAIDQINKAEGIKNLQRLFGNKTETKK